MSEGSGGSTTVRATSEPGDFDVEAVRFEPVERGRTGIEGTGEYAGAVEVVRGASGLGVVNDVTLADYLRGIVEVPATWPDAALEAQAVAARTYALWQLWSPSPSAWRALGADICASEACQVYRGLAGVERDGGSRWAAAVQRTEGLVLMRDGGIIKSMYSSSNGGRSRSGGAEDADDASASPYAHWRSDLPPAELLAALGVEGPAELVEVAGDGDAFRLTAERPDGSRVAFRLTPTELRKVANEHLEPRGGLPRPLPSPFFNLSLTDEGLVAEGRGHGHGIGLSQYGALAKARRGLSAEEILASYYSGIRPTALDPSSLPPRVRVAVVTGQREVEVVASEPVTVVDGDGNLLAPRASGAWRVVPAASGLRLLPPEEERGPLTATARVLEPSPAPIGESLSIGVDTSHPAVLSIEVAGPDGTTTEVSRGVVDAGERVAEIPGAERAGVRRVHLHLDAGGGRSSSLELPVRSYDPAAVARREPVRTPDGDGGIPWAVALVAGTLLAASGAGTARAARVRR